ncbi:hypothetical protein LTR37_016450 [Vermiconidia calcicola]|uniref:Uncharacterized protein n=1 Tax=Vermiconidia calcicola TaxID=1690605 RepID=A0ACC3MPF5_9PEZI|nr:hypothetical protein LTR37_016450 [Vermiconidia calcicola]
MLKDPYTTTNVRDVSVLSRLQDGDLLEKRWARKCLHEDHDLPSNVLRQLALDLLHSHEDFFRLYNLVIDVRSIEAPRDAEADEYYAEWYNITERLAFGAGLSKRILARNCFYNQAWGLQSPMIFLSLLEMKNPDRIGRNQPGEPREPWVLGGDKPGNGSYLREDIKMD